MKKYKWMLLLAGAAGAVYFLFIRQGGSIGRKIAGQVGVGVGIESDGQTGQPQPTTADDTPDNASPPAAGWVPPAAGVASGGWGTGKGSIGTITPYGR